MTQTRHYLAFDGLRGIAALAVVSLHGAEYFRLPVQPGHAYLAVDFFFMLSGFVIAHAYDARLSRGMGVTRFLAVRLIRLQPLVLLALGVGLVLAVSLTHGGLNAGFAWHDFPHGGARVLFPFVMGVMLSRYASAGPDHPAWAHGLCVPLLLILCAPAFGGGRYDAAAVLLFFPGLLLAAARAPLSQRSTRSGGNSGCSPIRSM